MKIELTSNSDEIITISVLKYEVDSVCLSFYIPQEHIPDWLKDYGPLSKNVGVWKVDGEQVGVIWYIATDYFKQLVTTEFTMP